jgi:hypothetical protein
MRRGEYIAGVTLLWMCVRAGVTMGWLHLPSSHWTPAHLCPLEESLRWEWHGRKTTTVVGVPLHLQQPSETCGKDVHLPGTRVVWKVFLEF